MLKSGYPLKNMSLTEPESCGPAFSGMISPKITQMDWFKGNFIGKPNIYWENRWFPVDFPLNHLEPIH
jgi:hypothetical protein